MKKHLLVPVCLLSLLVSCGNTSDPNDDKEREEDTNQETQGYYESQLVPLNTGVAGSTVGTFHIRILGDEVKVTGSVQNSPHVFHRQFIHAGGDCPGPGADSNRDGNLDFNESLRITGDALIPLDRNLSTQTAGYVFPVPGSSGNYSYSETTSLVRMMADLHADDPDPEDFLSKLSPDDELNLTGRTIVLYGVHGNASFPIACGKIVRAVEPLPDQPDVRTFPPRNPRPRPRPIPLPPRIPWGNSFDTTLSEELRITGVKCSGGERTEDNWVCLTNQWIVTIDNETDVGPFIANLVLELNVSNGETAYYDIRPTSPIDDETFLDAKNHWVRFDRNGPAVVLPKPE
jgi:hypothetical protein